MSAPARKDIVFRAGDPYTLTIYGQNPDGSVKDLSGTWASQIRQTPDAATIAASFTVDMTNASAANGGIVVFSLSEATTAPLSPGRYTYDVHWTGNGTPIGGDVTITPAVTR